MKYDVEEADPSDFSSEDGQLPVAAALAARSRELELLRGQLGEIALGLAQTPPQPIIGLLDGHDQAALSSLAGISVAVTLAELRRRVGGFEVRSYLPASEPQGVGLGDEAAVPLLPWDVERLHLVLSEVEALVVCGDLGAAATQAIIADVSSGGMAIEFVDPPEEPPRRLHSLALAGRLLDQAILDQRAEYLRVVGVLPESDRFVLSYLADPETPRRSEVTGALTSISRRSGWAVVTATDDLAPVNLLAMVAAAALIVTDSAALSTLAIALDRPALGVVASQAEGLVGGASPDGLILGKPGELGALSGVLSSRSIDTQARQRGERAGDSYFDSLGRQLVSACARRVVQTLPQRLQELTARTEALESVNAALRQTMANERSALALYVRTLRLDAGPGTSSTPPAEFPEVEELQLAKAQVDDLKDELARIYATRTMRFLQPFRRAYGRLRATVR